MVPEKKNSVCGLLNFLPYQGLFPYSVDKTAIINFSGHELITVCESNMYLYIHEIIVMNNQFWYNVLQDRNWHFNYSITNSLAL
jgi:hypothetical protein